MSTESSTPSPVVSSVAPSPAPAPRGRGPLFVAGGVAAAVLVFIGWGFWKAGQPPAPYFQGQMEAKEADIAPKVTARISKLLVTEGQKARYTYAQPDALIAATAKVHGLAVVTRNVEDFVQAGVPILNPWAPA